MMIKSVLSEPFSLWISKEIRKIFKRVRFNETKSISYRYGRGAMTAKSTKRFQKSHWRATTRMALLGCLSFTSVFSDPFVTADLAGRLGNQLFQVAAAVSLALDHGAEAKFSTQLLNQRDYDIHTNYQHVFWRVGVDNLSDRVSCVYREPVFYYRPIPFYPNMKITGWFQSEKYFKHHKEEIVSLFSPSDEITAYLNHTYADLIQNSKAVAVHVRCYHLENRLLSNVYPIYKKKYFLKVMALFPEDSLFVIFSDQIKWCKQEFSNCGYRIRFIENEPHYCDFYLMSMFKNMIISNSTFSWWAAYINPHPDKVVFAPKKWLKKLDDSDIVPEDWIVVE